jgi:hypothetical protein
MALVLGGVALVQRRPARPAAPKPMVGADATPDRHR